MDAETPVLMIALQIPILKDTSAEQVLSVIKQKVAEALAEIKDEQRNEMLDPKDDLEAIPQAAFNASVLKEAEEAFSDSTAPDILSAMGYPAEA